MRKTTDGVATEEKIARDVLLAQSTLQNAMTAYLKRYLSSHRLPVREDAIDGTFVSIISGERPPMEMQELVQQYVDILRDESAVIDPFKVVMTVKLLLMTAEGLASEAMAISKYLFSVGIRVMALNTPVPEPHQLVVMINRCCQTIATIQIAPPVRSAAMPPFLGAGRYQTKEELGRGAFGVVHKALDTSLRRYVAIKRLAGDTSLPHFTVKLANLQQEAQTLARLSHANIVQVYDLLREDESLFIIMEFIGGGTLKSLIDDGILLSWPLHERLRFLIAVCSGVECAHGQGVLHLDLKPGNILVAGGESFEPKIADFGIAQLVRHDGNTARSAGGTPLYMAPEQRSPGVPVTQAADVYALAKVVHEVLTGEIGMAVDVTNDALPSALRPVMAAALKLDPNSRLSQVALLRECLVAMMA